jgi:hypothetical protein
MEIPVSLGNRRDEGRQLKEKFILHIAKFITQWPLFAACLFVVRKSTEDTLYFNCLRVGYCRTGMTLVAYIFALPEAIGHRSIINVYDR